MDFGGYSIYGYSWLFYYGILNDFQYIFFYLCQNLDHFLIAYII